MHYLERFPAYPLSIAVERLWLYQGYAPPHAFERVFPSGAVALVIILAEPVVRCYDPAKRRRCGSVEGPVVVGPKVSFDIIETAQQREMAGVVFRFGQASSLLGIPTAALHGLDVSLEEMWGAAALELWERLHTCRSSEGRLRLLERTLRARFDGSQVPHPAVDAALSRLEDPVGIPVGALASELGLSSRRFIEVFERHVGLTPKAYARVRRFQSALARIHRKTEIDWINLALDLGYFDQSHFIRDFKKFTGIAPTAYARLQGDQMNHVPEPEWGQIFPIPDSVALLESSP